MTSTEVLELLRGLYRDKMAMRQRHVAAARHIGHYDFNNTYQYVINREDTQLSWLRDAIVDMGGQPPEVPPASVEVSGRGDAAIVPIVAPDRDAAQAFVDTWGPRIDKLPNARHRTMLRLMLGETLEHKRFFEQALAGRTDLLGRRPDGTGTGGGVMPVRWVQQ